MRKPKRDATVVVNGRLYSRGDWPAAASLCDDEVPGSSGNTFLNTWPSRVVPGT